MGSLRTLQCFDLSSNSEDNIRQLGEMTDLRDLHVISPTEMSDPLKGKLIALVSSLEKLGNLKSIVLELAPSSSCTSIYLDCSWSISSLSIFLQRLELLPPICIFSRLPVLIGQLRKLLILKIGLRELTTGDVDVIAKLQELTTLSLYVGQPIKELIVFHPAAFPALKCFKFRCGIMRLAFQKDTMPSLQRLKLEFNAHSGEQSDNMLAGIEHLLNLKEISGRIGAAPGAEESERIAVESVFKDAISKHPRLTNFNLQIVCLFDEQCTKGSMILSDDNELNRHSMADGISELNKGTVSHSPEVWPITKNDSSRWTFTEDTTIAPHVDGSSSGYSTTLSQPQSQSPDDMYNWHKYAQTNVSASQNTYSYYSCAFRNCPAKKKVERSLDGQIANIEYKGTHNHDGPQKVDSWHLMADGILRSGASEATFGGMSGITTSSVSFETGVSSPRSGNSSGDKTSTKKRRRKKSKHVRVSQTMSDTIHDGYNWRKYGQKSVKGSPHPRGYYKCTTVRGCPARKQVERSSDDVRLLVTTYKGQHNHDVHLPSPAVMAYPSSGAGEQQDEAVQQSDEAHP